MTLIPDRKTTSGPEVTPLKAKQIRSDNLSAWASKLRSSFHGLVGACQDYFKVHG